MTDNIYAHLTEEDYANEVWKDITGYEGLYQVSSLGRVKSLERVVFFGKDKSIERLKKESFINPFVNNKGYFVVDFNVNGLRTKHLLHRLVAEEFVDNPFNKSEVNHKIPIKSLNTIDNLEWFSREENVFHSIESKCCDNNYGERHYNSKLSDKDISNIIELYSSGNYTQRNIAEIFGVHQSYISAIVNRKKRKVPTPVLEMQ